MTTLVDPSEIEGIVGIKRHEHDHYGRYVSAEKTVYILHSQWCVDHTEDLRDCLYSKALDEQVNNPDREYEWTRDWPRLADRVVLLHATIDDWYGTPLMWRECHDEEEMFSRGPCADECDGFVKRRWEGLACDCGNQWFCY